MDILVLCPHCEGTVIIDKKQINCAIFRHGVVIKTGMQMNAHATKAECDKLIANNSILGCGKPFKLIKINVNDTIEYFAETCDYI